MPDNEKVWVEIVVNAICIYFRTDSTINFFIDSFSWTGCGFIAYINIVLPSEQDIYFGGICYINRNIGYVTALYSSKGSSLSIDIQTRDGETFDPVDADLVIDGKLNAKDWGLQ